MRTKFLILTYLVLLISLVTAYDDPPPDRPRKRPQKYRIVKVYSRRLKNNVTPRTSSTQPHPLESIPAESWAYRPTEQSSEEFQLPRDMLQSSSDSPPKDVNLGEMDLENFDVAKLLAAAGHNAGSDPSGSTVIRLSAPSSGSALDPEYLSKLIQEQLGKDAQFQILPSSGEDSGFKHIIGSQQPPAHGPDPGQKPNGRQRPQQLRGGFKQSNQPLPVTTLRPSPPKDKPRTVEEGIHTYPARLQTSASDLRPAKQIKSEGDQDSRGQTLGSGQRSRGSSTEKPGGRAKNFPLYPRNPTGSKMIPFVRFPKRRPTTTTGQPTTTKSHYTKGISSSLPPVTDRKPEGYSTLSQQMTAPGIAPAITGQYAEGKGHHENEAISALASHKGPKYSTTFVRGFVEDAVTPQTPKKYTTPSSDQKKEESQTYTTKPKTKSRAKASIEVLKSIEEDSRVQSSENFEETEYSRTRSPFRGHRGHDLTNLNPPAEYDSPQTEYGPPTIEYGPPGTSDWNQHDAEQEHNAPPIAYGAPQMEPPPHPPKITKTIYINLPPEGPPTTTTPKPYKHQIVLPQKHYKIVFIKAPTVPPPEEPEIELPPPTPQTKTIIYVLHKKPEPAKKIVITAPPSTEAPSPEVFFIQYKDKNGDPKGEKDNEEQYSKNQEHSKPPVTGQKWEKPKNSESSLENGWEKSKNQEYSPGSGSKWEKPKNQDYPPESGWQKPKNQEYSPESGSKWEKPKTQKYSPEDRSKWEKPDNQGWKSGSGSSSDGAQAQWEEAKKSEWKPGPGDNKWQEPEPTPPSWSHPTGGGNDPRWDIFRNNGWNRPSEPNPNTNPWNPIFTSKDRDFRQEYDDANQGYPDAHYHMSASEIAPVRVSVTKTVTSKI